MSKPTAHTPAREALSAQGSAAASPAAPGYEVGPYAPRQPHSAPGAQGGAATGLTVEGVVVTFVPDAVPRRRRGRLAGGGSGSGPRRAAGGGSPTSPTETLRPAGAAGPGGRGPDGCGPGAETAVPLGSNGAVPGDGSYAGLPGAGGPGSQAAWESGGARTVGAANARSNSDSAPPPGQPAARPGPCMPSQATGAPGADLSSSSSGGEARAAADLCHDSRAGDVGAAAPASFDAACGSGVGGASGEPGALTVGPVSFSVGLGEVVGLLGPSGSGKSTILRVIAGLQRPTAGRVCWEGRDLAGVPVHRRGIGLVFQDGQLFAHKTVAGNIEYGLRIDKLPAAQRHQRVAELLDLVGLAGLEDRPVTTLSGGERQRVALARSLAPRPRALLLDEPLSALDRDLRDRLAGDLREILTATGTTAIYVTHDATEAATVCDRTIHLRA